MAEIWLSKSLIDTFLQCGLKFSKRYIERIRVAQDSESMKSAIFGSMIHSVMETYFKDTKLNLLELYKEEFKKAPITDREFYLLGENLITNYVNDSKNGDKILGVEVEFQHYLNNGIPIKGIIDRVNEISDDEIEIIDYKTGYSPPLSEEELEKDLQMGMYNLAALELYPKYKRVKLTLNYLHYGNVSCYKTKEQLESLKNYLSVIYSKIMSMLEEKKEFSPRVNSYCSFCDYKNQCPKFKEIVSEDSKDSEALVESYTGLINRDLGVTVPLDRVDEFLFSVKSRIKILKKLEDEIKGFILSYAKEGNIDSNSKVKVGKSTYSVSFKKDTAYDVNTVLEVFSGKPIDFNQILKARKKEIDALVKDDTKAVRDLKRTSRDSYSDSFLR